MSDEDPPRDAAALSSIASLVDDLTQRVTEVADRYATTPSTGVAEDLYAAERSLVTARRAIQRARSALT